MIFCDLPLHALEIPVLLAFLASILTTISVYWRMLVVFLKSEKVQGVLLALGFAGVSAILFLLCGFFIDFSLGIY